MPQVSRVMWQQHSVWLPTTNASTINVAPNYRLGAKVGSGCDSLVSATNTNISEKQLQLFPNPASSTVNGAITLAQPLMLNAFVYNTLNMVVAQKQQQGAVGVNTVSVNIATLPAGLYLYRLYYGNQVCAATFMKQ